MHNPNKCTKLTLDSVSCPKSGRSLFKGMKTTILLLTLTSSLTLAQTGADKVSGPMRKYGGTQLVQVKERPPTLDETMVYTDFRRSFMSTEVSIEFSCYLGDYVRTYFINGHKMPGAPDPATYCRARRQADVDAGLKPPLHEIDSWNRRKAQEKFYRENPDANPWAKEEAEQAKTNKPSPQKTNSATQSDPTKTDSKEGEKK